MNRRTGLIVTAVFLAGLGPAPVVRAETPVRVYFIGNSVTDTINYRALAELAENRGHKHVWGRHMIPGAPLQWIWQHPKDGFQEQPFGHYPTALADHQLSRMALGTRFGVMRNVPEMQPDRIRKIIGEGT